MAVAITDTSDLAPKTRIVATTNLPGVPEGTAGKVGRSVGLTLTRYRVAFDNGVDITSVTHTKLVKEDEWDDYRERREAGDAEVQAQAVTEPAAAGDAGNTGSAAAAADPNNTGNTGSAADDRLAALLAKSKAAKAKKLGTEPAADSEPAAADPQPEAAAPAAGDDRLAALLAKSKAAKAAKLAEG